MTNSCKDCEDSMKEFQKNGVYPTPECLHVCGMHTSVPSVADCIKYFGEIFRLAPAENRSAGHDDFQKTDMMPADSVGFDNLPRHQLN